MAPQRLANDPPPRELTSLEIRDAHEEPSLSAVRGLFLEYARSLGISLEFQRFDAELASLPGEYAPPTGALMLALVDGAAAGCVGLHSWQPRVAEMKRLYVRQEFRGTGIGRALAEAAMARALSLRYERLRLDTLPLMASAQALYRQLGFREIAPYRDNPVAGAKYYEVVLNR